MSVLKVWFAIAGLAGGAVMSCFAGLANGAGAAASQVSARVAVIPGFVSPVYPGENGLAPFPAGDAALKAYTFAQIAPASVTPAALSGFDTIVLYGERWSTLPATAQSAINGFARTGKVIIWDADSTGSQAYDSFLKPFSTRASGEDGATTGSAVTFPAGEDPLASDDPASPLFLDPHALVGDNHLVAHMNVMQTGTPGWNAGLVAANQEIPGGGWVLSWAYGSDLDKTGMLIYSGLDADAFHDAARPNYAIKELAIELAAQFARTPPTGGSGGGSGGSGGGSGGSGGGSGGSGGGSGGSGGGSGGTGSYAQCSFERPVPTGWVRGDVTLSIKTSAVAGLTGDVELDNGKRLADGRFVRPGHLRVQLDTRRLRSDTSTRITAVIRLNSVRACALRAVLHVDNIPARIRWAKISHTGSHATLNLGVNEPAAIRIVDRGRSGRSLRVLGDAARVLTLPGVHGHATIVVTDRAGNITRRPIAW